MQLAYMCRAFLACTLVVIVNLNPFLTACPLAWLALYIAGKQLVVVVVVVVVAKAVSTKRLCAPALHSPGGGLASLLGGGGGVMGLAWFCSFLSSCFCSLCLTPTCPCLSFQRLLRTRLETPSRDTQDTLCREPHLSCITLRHIHNS